MARDIGFNQVVNFRFKALECLKRPSKVFEPTPDSISRPPSISKNADEVIVEAVDGKCYIYKLKLVPNKPKLNLSISEIWRPDPISRQWSLRKAKLVLSWKGKDILRLEMHETEGIENDWHWQVGVKDGWAVTKAHLLAECRLERECESDSIPRMIRKYIEAEHWERVLSSR